MAELDIENIGPQLKRIKISQLQPDLLEGVLELAEEHGYEITITSLSDVHFLFRIYQSEKIKQKKDLKRLKKAEDLILRLAGVYSLHHDEERRKEKERQDTDEKRPKARPLALEEDMRVSRKMKELFESVGITDERDMQQGIGFLGEAKIEERISIAKKTTLGPELLKKVFGEHPEELWKIKDDAFLDQMNAMEAKKGIIDAWSGANNQAPPLWADYNQSPSVLLVDFEVILAGLGIGKLAEEEEGKPPGVIEPERTVPARPSAGVEAPRPAKETDEEADMRRLSILHDPRSEMAVRAYKREGGGLRGKLAALSELGIDVTRLSSVRESISTDSKSGSATRDQERFDSGIDVFFDLVVGKGLEELVNAKLGTAGLKIGKVGYLIGANGAFELRMADAEGRERKRVYLSLQDMEPARIGKDAAEAGGLVTYSIWTRDQEGFSLSAGGMKYALSEDARDVGERGKIALRMPGSFEMEDAVAKGAAMFREDLALRPDPQDGLHSDFYREMARPEGRKEILAALAAYFEISRRTLLPDRRPANTFVLRVEREDGTRRFTFQPTDMDGIGNFIGGKAGKADFRDYDRDFHKAAADFAVQLHEGMLRAAARGMISGSHIPSPGALLRELSSEARMPAPPDAQRIVDARRSVFRFNDGGRIGVGFDAAEHVGSTIPSQGGSKRIEDRDGRVTLDAEACIRTAAEAASQEAWNSYSSGMEKAGVRHMTKLGGIIADVVKEMRDAMEMPDELASEKAARAERMERLSHRTGGEIALRIASEPGAGGVREAVEAKAREMLFGVPQRPRKRKARAAARTEAAAGEA